MNFTSSYIKNIVVQLEKTHEKAKTSRAFERKASRGFFLWSLAGGFVYFVVLAGKSKKMNFSKVFLYCYGVGPVMKLSGSIGLIYYIN